jgi:kynureninase
MIDLKGMLRLPVSKESASKLDTADPLAALRKEYMLPQGVYFAGHSLGPAPRLALALLEREYADWARHGVHGHKRAHTPWVDYAESLSPALARLVGAAPDEVIAMNSLTVNLHLLLASFFRPLGARNCILMEGGAFSSDRHAVEGQLRWHGLDPDQHLIELTPRAGELCLRDDDVLEAIESYGPRLALVLWPGVQYRTGQAFDCRAIARVTHAAGALIGFDHAHAVGNLLLDLHGDDADFGVWCSYKYLNSGPGALAGAFVHERHHQDSKRLRLGGWFGHELQTRFAMLPGFKPAAGAAGWAVSNPPIFAAVPLAAALQLFDRAGMPALRAKSQALTAWLEHCLRDRCGDRLEFVTPANSQARGAMLTLRLTPTAQMNAAELLTRLEARGLSADTRGDWIRLAPAPLFNTYADCLQCADWLGAELTASN